MCWPAQQRMRRRASATHDPNVSEPVRKVSRTGKTAKHETNTGGVQHSIGSVDLVFVILAQTAVLIQPGKGVFRHPATRDDLKAALPRLVLDNLDFNRKTFGQRLQPFAAIARIGPELSEARKLGGQERDQPTSDFPILVVGLR